MNQEQTRTATGAGQAVKMPGPGARFSAVLAAAKFDRRSRASTKREKKLLTDAGAEIVASMPLVDLPQADAQALRARIADVVLQMNDLDIALRESLDKDRQDYAKASQLMRWIVVGRGMMDRWILQDRVRFHARERARLNHELGLLVFDGKHEALRGSLPAPVRDGIAWARADIVSTQKERSIRLAPWNGQPLPPWMARAARETGRFLYHFWDQLSRRLFLRVPAIGALVVSWWIAHTYTADTIERIRYSMHLGGRTPMDPQTLKYMTFWIPLAAAAFFSYLASIVASHVQRKYAPPRA